MRKRLNFILVATALMLCVGTMQAQKTSLLVHTGAGDPQAIELSSIGKITFSEGSANVLFKNGESTGIPIADIDRLTFGAAPTGIPILDVSTLNLYPNPVRDELYVTSETEIESIVVYSLLGKEMLRSNVRSLTTTLSLGALPAGAYVIQVKRADTVSAQKIIKL